MSSHQREKHLDAECTPVESSVPEAIDVMTEHSQGKQLSISQERSGITNISPEKLERIWDKAKRLLYSPGSICKAPDMSDAICVTSETGSRPHIVSKTKREV